MSVFSNLAHKTVMVENTYVDSDNLIEKLQHGWWIEPDIGGYRMLTVVSADSIDYLNERLKPITHLASKHFDHIFRNISEDVVIDGELFGFDWFKLTPEKRRDGIDQLIKKATYFVYDILPLSDFLTQNSIPICLLQRRDMLQSAYQHLRGDGRVSLVKYDIVKSLDDAEELAAGWIREHFGGGILKDPESPYVFDKSNYWIHIKPSTAETFKCISAIQGSRQLEAIRISVNNVTTDVSAGFSEVQRKQFHHRPDLIINKPVDIKYQSMDNLGKLVLPRFVSVRYDL